MAQIEEHLEPLGKLAAESLSATVQNLEEVGGGRNSRVYRLMVSPSRSFALKAYFQHSSDKRDRMRTEFDTLCFLWRNGVRNVPKPVMANSQHRFAIYDWIEGSGIAHATAAEIHAAARFLSCLSELRQRPDSGCFGVASEACFSGPELLENLNCRLKRLLFRDENPELQAFLEDKFRPSLKVISDWSRQQAGSSFDIELNQDVRILSPSDFGFHNALQTKGGDIFFLDFEYFGWDDLAKTISDFLLHPAMSLSPELKRSFVASVMESLPCQNDFEIRLKAFYPLFGLKWCLILLNEFLPEQLLRRRFAGNSHATRRTQAEQLRKAEEKLQQTLTEYEHLPYID